MIKHLLVFAGCLCVIASQNCFFDGDMFGTWFTTSLETVTLQNSTPQFSMTKTFTGSTGSSTDFDCVAVNGTQHVLKSTTSLTVFSGTDQVNIYMCIDLRRFSNASFNYYLNSPVEVGLGNSRLVGILITENVTDPIARVCTVTLDEPNYEVMYKIGDEVQAAYEVQCPDVLLGNFNFKYTDSTGTHCDASNGSISACDNQNLTLIAVNNTDCTSPSPFYSSGGSLGCITTFTNTTSQISYTTLYNFDTTVDDSDTYRLVCVVSTSEANGTVYLTMKPTVCASGQTPTDLPTGGATMEMIPYCVPGDTTSSDTDWTWLIILLCLLGFVIILIILIVCCYLYHRKLERDKAREKKILITEEHPLGEMSITLDAPRSMEPISENAYLESRASTYRTPRTKKKELPNPLSETSLNLDFKGRSWNAFRGGEMQPSIMDMDPFTEMDTGAVVPISPQGSKTVRSFRGRRQKSFLMNERNGHIPKSQLNGYPGKPLPITDGTTGMPDSPTSMRRARSERSLTSLNLKAPGSVQARSVRAPSVKAFSVKGSTVAAVRKAPSVKAGSVRSTRSRGSDKRPALQRSATSTRLGSVTRRLTGNKKKKIARSKTMIIETKPEAGRVDGTDMAEFAQAEMQTWAETNRTAPSVKSARSSTRSAKTSKSKASSAPRKSILKSMSAYTSSKEYLTEAEQFERNVHEYKATSMDTVQETYLSVKQKSSMTAGSNRPLASKNPWR